MIATNDRLLEDCRPIDMSRKAFLLDCEESINITDVHSDEISSDDEFLAEEERNKKKRPENILKSNSVIKVYEKKWRSRRVCKVVIFLKIQPLCIIIFFYYQIKKILHRAEEIAINVGTGLTRIRHRSDNYIDRKNKPKDNVPVWWISASWVSSESEEDEDNVDNEGDHDENDKNNNDGLNNQNDDGRDKNDDNNRGDQP